MVINNRFNIGDIVFLQTDVEQNKRLVTGINIRPDDIIYVLSCGAEESWHYDFEITEELDILLTSTN